MSDLFLARLQMATTMAFHIIFASTIIVLPSLAFLSELIFSRNKTEQKSCETLSIKWSRAILVLFAVGAASGTLLSFELGLLFPKFMSFAGPIFGLPFAIEGVVFLLEAIFLSVYIYWREFFPEKLRIFSALIISVLSIISGILVISANGWMQTPTGFLLDMNGKAIEINPVAAMFNKSWFHLSAHMIFAAFQAIGFLIAGIHGFILLKFPSITTMKDELKDIHKRALKISLIVAAVFSLLQIPVGHLSGQKVAENQPIKLAAMEALWESKSGAGLYIGGIPDEKAETTRYAIEIPKLLSFLSYSDINSKVTGLKDFPKDHRPPVFITHIAFQVMVFSGFLLASFSLLFLLALKFFRQKINLFENKLFLLTTVLLSPLGMLALQSGWIVTEVGRQPWIIYEIMKTQDALASGVSQNTSFLIPFICVSLTNTLMGLGVIFFIFNEMKSLRADR